MRLRLADVAHLLPVEPVAVLPPGTVVAEGFIAGRPQPWKAFTVGKQRADYKRFQAWKEQVRFYSSLQGKSRRPYAGEVKIDVVFWVKRDPGGRIQLADLDNLRKAFIDGLQGSAIVNDRAVWGGTAERIYSLGVEGAWFRVVAAPAPEAYYQPGLMGASSEES